MDVARMPDLRRRLKFKSMLWLALIRGQSFPGKASGQGQGDPAKLNGVAILGFQQFDVFVNRVDRRSPILSMLDDALPLQDSQVMRGEGDADAQLPRDLRHRLRSHKQDHHHPQSMRVRQKAKPNQIFT